jgi:hypothetical protein
LRALECFAQECGIVHAADEGFRAFLHEGLKLRRFAADDANVVTFRE